jgi:predicted hotdog family 3-hydroxylacyl-ACP dehydratase
MPLQQARIRQLIPHAGPMCLLDRATFWDASSIRCEAWSHLDPGNPLRHGGVLRAVTGIEYAAQAMALHAALAQGPAPARPGYLVSVREVSCKATALDAVREHLEIEAERLMGERTQMIYAFALRAAGVELVRGRATVILGEPGGVPRAASVS